MRRPSFKASGPFQTLMVQVGIQNFNRKNTVFNIPTSYSVSPEWKLEKKHQLKAYFHRSVIKSTKCSRLFNIAVMSCKSILSQQVRCLFSTMHISRIVWRKRGLLKRLMQDYGTVGSSVGALDIPWGPKDIPMHFKTARKQKEGLGTKDVSNRWPTMR